MSQIKKGYNLKVECVNSLNSVRASEWNTLTEGNPFISHDFLLNLETSKCLEPHGWFPNHLIIKKGSKLIAALPTYARNNSYGEFVFDWSWAEAYERAGRNYYPKLVSASPFSPVTGPRLLYNENSDGHEYAKTKLITAVHDLCLTNGLSSWHTLFFEPSSLDFYKNQGLLIRLGVQYHWQNHNFKNFAEFLATLNSKHRKSIKRERKKVADSKIQIEVIEGKNINEFHWELFYGFYCSTFRKKWSQPRLNKKFFLNVSDSNEYKPVLFLAKEGNQYVAGAFALATKQCLYGRHWGATKYHEYLHFELCYYQTIEYCIQNKIEKLDAGAQGEHKLKRGFHPVKTYSAHLIIEDNFRSAISEFLTKETEAIENYINSL